MSTIGVVIQLPEQLHRRLKAVCALEGNTLQKWGHMVASRYVATAEKDQAGSDKLRRMLTERQRRDAEE